MILNIRVVPKSSAIKVQRSNDTLKIHLTRPAADGQANAQLIEVLARYLNVKKYQIEIVKGHTNRNKIIKISDAASRSPQR